MGNNKRMPLVAKHAPGDFCWIELATSDQAAATSFYAGLFGWIVTEYPIGPNDIYTRFSIDGRDVGAAYTLRSEERAHGVPAHWNLYVAVENADAAAASATKLGGAVVASPFDVYNIGRMAVVQDPTGATFSLWQAKGDSGFGIRGVPGTFCAADLSTSDQDGASRFYAQLFGWRVGKEDEDPAHNYYHLFNHDEYIGGILPPAFRSPGVPSHWQIYLQVSDCDAVVEKATRLGAQIFVPPVQVEDIGRMAVLADPQGAAFALFEVTRP